MHLFYGVFDFVHLSWFHSVAFSIGSELDLAAFCITVPGEREKTTIELGKPSFGSLLRLGKK